MKKEKLVINVLIENDQLFTDEYNLNQKLQVIVNKTIEHLQITAEGRVLRRADGKELQDLSISIQESGILEGETLRFVKKVENKPDRNKRFA